MTWTLVLLLLGEPVTLPGFASKAACDRAAETLRKDLRPQQHACVEVKCPPCATSCITLTPSALVTP
jgi:hypothetical protein